MLFTRTRCLPQDPGPRIMTRVKKTTPPPPHQHTHNSHPVSRWWKGGVRNVFYWLAIFIWAATGRPLQVDFLKTPAARFKNVTNRPYRPSPNCCPPAALHHNTLQIGVAGHRERRGQRRGRELWTLTLLGCVRTRVKRQICYHSFFNLFWGSPLSINLLILLPCFQVLVVKHFLEICVIQRPPQAFF